MLTAQAPRKRGTMTELVAEEVRALMGRHRVSQATIAEVLGVSRQAVSKRLTGETPFDVNEVAKLGDYFGVQPSQLLPHLDSNQEPAGLWPRTDALEHARPSRLRAISVPVKKTGAPVATRMGYGRSW